MDCVFCQIRDKQLDAHLIAEFSDCFVIMDKFPLNQGHVLVVAKTHAGSMEQLPEHERHHMMDVAVKVTRAMKKASHKIKDVHYLINDGPVANQHVPHVHLHIIPRYGWDLTKLLRRFLTRFIDPIDRLIGDKALAKWCSDIQKHLE